MDRLINSMYFNIFPTTGMQNGDEASPSNILAGKALLVKMLITLGRMVYFVYIMYAYVFKHCPATGMQNGDEASPSIIFGSSSSSGNAHNS